WTHAATAIVVDHHALADARFLLADARAHRGDHAARLVTGDHRTRIPETELLCRLAGRRAVKFEITAAHAGGLDLEHDLARPRRRVREFAQLDAPVACEYRCFHGFLLCPAA